MIPVTFLFLFRVKYK